MQYQIKTVMDYTAYMLSSYLLSFHFVGNNYWLEAYVSETDSAMKLCHCVCPTFFASFKWNSRNHRQMWLASHGCFWTEPNKLCHFMWNHSLPLLCSNIVSCTWCSIITWKFGKFRFWSESRPGIIRCTNIAFASIKIWKQTNKASKVQKQCSTAMVGHAASPLLFPSLTTCQNRHSSSVPARQMLTPRV